jgi:hypothetical protein
LAARSIGLDPSDGAEIVAVCPPHNSVQRRFNATDSAGRVHDWIADQDFMWEGGRLIKFVLKVGPKILDRNATLAEQRITGKCKVRVSEVARL